MYRTSKVFSTSLSHSLSRRQHHHVCFFLFVVVANAVAIAIAYTGRVSRVALTGVYATMTIQGEHDSTLNLLVHLPPSAFPVSSPYRHSFSTIPLRSKLRFKLADLAFHPHGLIGTSVVCLEHEDADHPPPAYPPQSELDTDHSSSSSSSPQNVTINSSSNASSAYSTYDVAPTTTTTSDVEGRQMAAAFAMMSQQHDQHVLEIERLHDSYYNTRINDAVASFAMLVDALTRQRITKHTLYEFASSKLEFALHLYRERLQMKKNPDVAQLVEAKRKELVQQLATLMSVPVEKLEKAFRFYIPNPQNPLTFMYVPNPVLIEEAMFTYQPPVIDFGCTVTKFERDESPQRVGDRARSRSPARS
jgi:hypothetical protein